MIVFILARLLQAIPVLIAVGVIAFAMFRYVGDPIGAMLGQDYPFGRLPVSAKSRRWCRVLCPMR